MATFFCFFEFSDVAEDFKNEHNAEQMAAFQAGTILVCRPGQHRFSFAVTKVNVTTAAGLESYSVDFNDLCVLWLLPSSSHDHHSLVRYKTM